MEGVFADLRVLNPRIALPSSLRTVETLRKSKTAYAQIMEKFLHSLILKDFSLILNTIN